MKCLAELQGLAALCGPTENEATATPPMFFGGAATPQSGLTANVAEGPLLMPTMSFEKAAK